MRVRVPIHILVEYNQSPDFDKQAPRTVENHEEKIREHASVLWPKMSKTGRLRLTNEEAIRINSIIENQRSSGMGETHFYMYALKCPKHEQYPEPRQRLHIGKLYRIHLESQIDIEDQRIPAMYDELKHQLRIPFCFEITEIKEVQENRVDEVLRNLLTYPDVTFLDLVSLISPQAVLEAEPISLSDLP